MKSRYQIATVHFLLTLALAVADTTFAHQTLLTIEPSESYPRNSEGDIIELSDGSLCLIYTRFTGGTSDDATAHLALRISRDGGNTWSADRVVVPNDAGFNVMSVSLLRLRDGRIALFYLHKQSSEDCRPVMRLSDDEAVTFSEPTTCITDEVGYYVLNNDRAVQLASGRLVLPVAWHNRPGRKEPDWTGRVMCYFSDDNGRSWQRSRSTLTRKTPDGSRISMQEPGVIELADKKLMMFCRTDAGSQYISFSTDGADTWSELVPSDLHSPLSPATIERLPTSGTLVCVWNDHSGVHRYAPGKRSPLCLAISTDEGKTWSKSQLLETRPDGWYCYTSMTFLQDRLLLTYCAGDKRVGGLNRLKITSLAYDFLEQQAATAPARPPQSALLQPCLDYGRSFLNSKANWNSPRFWVESRCRITDSQTNRTVEYLQCGLCKAENTFGHRDLFLRDNYDFLPIFSQQEGIIFRRRVRAGQQYRDVRPLDKWFGGTEQKLRTSPGRILNTPEAIFQAMQAGLPLVGQTELRDERSGRVAIIEYPVKTINFERDQQDWQVDTGPLILPRLNVAPDQWSETIQLAHIAFRSWHWSDFIADQATPVTPDHDEIQTYHYSKQIQKTARNVLLALDVE